MRTNSSSVATKYQHSQVSHADPVQLIVLLYDGALSRIAQGRQRLQEKDLPHAGVAISKAQAIVGELRQSLNMEAGGEVAKNLNSLYAYVHDLLAKAMRENLAEPLEEATNLLNELRGAWSEVAKQAKAVFETNQTAVRSQGAAGGNQDATRVQLKA
ncbi:MAG: flagellar export chaperone FliS [Nitrospirae bacterium]|nr:MAG: flagellar export chaperone FliS [Nitrospirota bacterium]